MPLSLANMPRTVQFGVFEIGMNHAGEIDALTRLVRPEIAIVTTVAPVHLGFFRSIEEIADAKAEIFHGLEPGGVAVINRDSPYYERLKAHALEHGARIVGFGEAQGAAAGCSASSLSPTGLRSTPIFSVRHCAIGSARRGVTWCRIRSPCSPRRSSPAPISNKRPPRSKGLRRKPDAARVP